MNITHEHVQHVQHLHKRAHAARAQLEKWKERISGTTTKVVRTLEVGATAAIGGLMHGKAGPKGAHFMGVPIDLGAGLALSLLGYFDAAKDYSDHLNNFGDGFLASYLSAAGFEIGQNWGASGHLSLFAPKAAPALAAPIAAGGVTPQDIAAMIQR